MRTLEASVPPRGLSIPCITVLDPDGGLIEEDQPCLSEGEIRHQAEPIIRSEDPRGRPLYWVGPPGVEQDAGPGTDFHAVNSGFVSVTPLQVDLTRHRMLESLRDWLNGGSYS